MEPFFLRALIAGVGLAVIAAPLGCFVVWRRMAYFGETIAQASLIGVAAGLALSADLTVSVVVMTVLMAGVLMALERQKVVPVDSLLGTMHYVALAAGIIATSLLTGPTVNVMGFLFGDVLAVSNADLALLTAAAIVVYGVLYRMWQPLLQLSIHPELAAAEGVPVDRIRIAYTLLLALVIALAIKVVGALLAIAFLIIPAVAARPLVRSPETMAAAAVAIAVMSAVLGLLLSSACVLPTLLIEGLSVADLID
ncbi:MAG: metal ABC transporter permease, partial [Hyphomicrobiaceae bacterium]|nr:metal ABC transporter permease [Hyphomicrobiaceae bacterium]